MSAQRSSLGLMASFLYWSKTGQNLVASSAESFIFCAMSSLRFARRFARSNSTSLSLIEFGCAWALGVLCGEGCAACPHSDMLHRSTVATSIRTVVTPFFIVASCVLDEGFSTPGWHGFVH